MNQQTTYPGISDILRRKAEARRDIAKRTLGQKIAMVEAMRERLEPFKLAREERSSARQVRTSR